MNVIVFGATGATGRLVVDKALEAGHNVTAFVRDATRLDMQHPRLKVFEGSLINNADVESAIQGQQAVICTLGAPLMSRDRVRTWGTQAIVNAMLKAHVNRLVCLSSFGVGDSYEHLPPLYRYVVAPFILRRVLQDHTAQEDIVRRSGLQWTFVRPVNLTDAPASGRYLSGTGKPDHKLSMKVARADVANFIVQQLGQSAYLEKAAFMSNAATHTDQSLCAAKNSRA